MWNSDRRKNIPNKFSSDCPCFQKRTDPPFWHLWVSCFFSGISNPIHGNLTPLPMISWPLTHDILIPLPMLCQTPYKWYIEPLIHSILNPVPMVYWTPNPWYFDPSTHGILTPYLWYLDPLSLAYRSPYPLYFDPPIHDNLTPYSWYIEPPTHGILYIWQRICSVCRNRNPFFLQTCELLTFPEHLSSSPVLVRFEFLKL